MNSPRFPIKIEARVMRFPGSRSPNNFSKTWNFSGTAHGMLFSGPLRTRTTWLGRRLQIFAARRSRVLSLPSASWSINQPSFAPIVRGNPADLLRRRDFIFLTGQHGFYPAVKSVAHLIIPRLGRMDSVILPLDFFRVPLIDPGPPRDNCFPYPD